VSDSPIAVAVALIVRDRTVLMGQRRPTKVYPLHWEFPGGKLESGETHEAALARELHEELGIQATIDELIFSELASYSTGATYDIRYHIVRSYSGDIQNHEFESVGWFSREDLPGLLHLTGNERILKKLDEEGIPI
jgi:8-oxo-dGTP diphosphatase